MDLKTATYLITSSIAQMNAIFDGTVFDEWAVIHLDTTGLRPLVYSGPREAYFEHVVASDLASLNDLLPKSGPTLAFGHFEFARSASGSAFDAYIHAGDGILVIFNHTTEDMDALASNPLWIDAQEPFATLAERFMANPIILS